MREKGSADERAEEGQLTDYGHYEQDMSYEQVGKRWGLSVIGVEVRARAMGLKLDGKVWPGKWLQLGDRYQRRMEELRNGV